MATIGLAIDERVSARLAHPVLCALDVADEIRLRVKTADGAAGDLVYRRDTNGATTAWMVDEDVVFTPLFLLLNGQTVRVRRYNGNPYGPLQGR